MSATSKVGPKAPFPGALGGKTMPRPPALKKGDLVELDCGYHGISEMKVCRLLSDPVKDTPLFQNSPDSYSAKVEILENGDRFTASFAPTLRRVSDRT